MPLSALSVRFGVLCSVFLLLIGPAAAQQARPWQLAVPVDPITTILEAFRTNQLVALGEGTHNNEQGHRFRLALIRDPRFAATVQDIVVEFGNARYQPLMDRFVRGEEVPSDSLRVVWQNTTQPHEVWDVPIYEEFFRAVRDVNLRLPEGRRLRVLLGDPPIDWDSVWTIEDDTRDRHPADLIRREVLARGRRALLIWGHMHLQRRDVWTNYSDSSPTDLLLPILERETGTRVFSIWTNTDADLEFLQPDVASWPAPSLAFLRGTVFGASDFTFYWPHEDEREEMRDGKAVTVPRERWRTLRMEDQFDAVLYLAHPMRITYARPSAALCADSAYIAMRSRRTKNRFPSWAADFHAWCAQRPNVFPLLFEAYRSGGIEQALARYADLKATAASNWDFGAIQLDTFGMWLLRTRRLNDAVRVFQLNADLFPAPSATRSNGSQQGWEKTMVHNRLAYAYVAKGDTARAIASFQRSVELDPSNATAVDALKRLGVRR